MKSKIKTIIHDPKHFHSSPSLYVSHTFFVSILVHLCSSFFKYLFTIFFLKKLSESQWIATVRSPVAYSSELFGHFTMKPKVESNQNLDGVIMGTKVAPQKYLFHFHNPKLQTNLKVSMELPPFVLFSPPSSSSSSS